jgi:transposase InsO family protein
VIEAEVAITRGRSGWSARRTLRALGVPPATYYRQRQLIGRSAPPRPVALDEALPAERAAVLAFAAEHPELRHRAMAWQMVDQDVAALSPSTVYRILAAAGRVAAWQPKRALRRRPLERPEAPNQVWQTDLRYVKVGGRTYYLLVFLDVCSRFVTYHELLRHMDGTSVATAAQCALEQVPEGLRGAIRIQSDNGGPFVSGEFGRVLAAHGVGHHRIYPHTPEQNGFVERVIRTLGDALHEDELADFYQAQQAVSEIVDWYNHRRLHSALGFVTPALAHAGLAEQLHAQRHQKLAAARAHRRAINLGRRQLPLPLGPGPSSQSGTATLTSRLSHCV